LDQRQIQQVVDLIRLATDADGASPLSEEGMLRLQHDTAGTTRHFLAYAPRATVVSAVASTQDAEAAPVRDNLVGYAQLHTVDSGDTTGELVVHPLRRHRGVGSALLQAALAADPAGRLRMWAHGDHPAAVALATRWGLRRERVLWQMRRSLSDPIPELPLPEGVHLRTFQVGRDEEAWLEVNRRAFASHPEQGRWTAQDLQLRMQEPWFDPAGFFLAVREVDGALLGFHWTKVHAAAKPDGAKPIGEVYVLGIDPVAQGLKLGKALALAGLRHLQQRGLHQVMLYVDEANTVAVHLYTKLGFVRWITDVQFARSDVGSPPTVKE